MMKTTQIYKICNCLEGLPEIPDKSVDMILTDLPYGITDCIWDNTIKLDCLWPQYRRIIKDSGIIILTASQPFTSQLVMSAIDIFRYDLIFEKTQPKGFLNANKMPMRAHENILIFYKKLPVYNPQFTEGKSYVRDRTHEKPMKKGVYIGNCDKIITTNNGKRYPRSVIKFSNSDHSDRYHATQKPLELFEYLIKTYTNEGDTVHDSCLGSGTTLKACMNLNRNCIGFEIDPQYESIYKDHLSKHNTTEPKKIMNTTIL